MRYETLASTIQTRQEKAKDALARVSKSELAKNQRHDRVLESPYNSVISQNRRLVEAAQAIVGLWSENGYFKYLTSPSNYWASRVGPTILLGSSPAQNPVVGTTLRHHCYRAYPDSGWHESLRAEFTFSFIDDEALALLQSDPIKYWRCYQRKEETTESSYYMDPRDQTRDELYKLAYSRMPRKWAGPVNAIARVTNVPRARKTLTRFEDTLNIVRPTIFNEKLNPFWAERANQSGVAEKIFGGEIPSDIHKKTGYSSQEYLEAAQAYLEQADLTTVKYYLETGIVKVDELSMDGLTRKLLE